jgi:large subunit ribosomal protein L22
MGQGPNPRRVEENEAMACARMIRTSPQKLNLVAELIRGLPAGRAASELALCRRRVANEVRKVLMAAIANAEYNHQLDLDRLYVAQATVGKALMMRRFSARARGRASRVVKPFSNLRVVLRERPSAAAAGGED